MSIHRFRFRVLVAWLLPCLLIPALSVTSSARVRATAVIQSPDEGKTYPLGWDGPFSIHLTNIPNNAEFVLTVFNKTGSYFFFRVKRPAPGSADFTLSIPAIKQSGDYKAQIEDERGILDRVLFYVGRHQIHVKLAGKGGGKVTSAPSGIDCGSRCTSWFWDGTNLRLTPHPAPDSAFVGWVGCAGAGAGDCRFEVGKERTVTAEFQLLRYRPDAAIAKNASGPYAGVRIYNLTGRRQWREASVRQTHIATFYVKLVNRGNTKDAYRVAGDAGTSGFTVRYFVASQEVTGAVTSGGYVFHGLAPGDAQIVRMTVAVGSGVRDGAARNWLVTAISSHDPDRADAVRAKVTVV